MSYSISGVGSGFIEFDESTIISLSSEIAVPEPSTYLMLIAAAGGLALARRRQLSRS